MLYIKVKRILKPKEIDIDKCPIIIIKWQRCGARRRVLLFPWISRKDVSAWKSTLGLQMPGKEPEGYV
jgi:hypothetical protein